MANNESVLIFPPLAYPMSPYLSVPLLVGQLKAAGFDAIGQDYNADFHNDSLSSVNLIKSIDKSNLYLKDLSKAYKKFTSADSAFKKMNYEDKLFLLKKENIEEFFSKNKNIEQTVGFIDEAVKIIKSNKDFYDPELAIKAIDTIALALEIFFLPYSPAQTYLTVKKPYFSLNYDDIDYQCSHREFNPFIEYFENKISEHDFINTNFAAISVPYAIQLVPALTLAKELKKQTKAHINIGGNLVNRVIDAFANNKEVFSDYVDSVSIGEGEVSIIELAEYVNSKAPIESVSGLYYLNSNGVLKNNKKPETSKIKTRYNVDFTGYNFKSYFSPEVIMPIQFSKGCYWGKCTFCDISHGKPYFEVCSIDEAINQIEFFITKYNIKKFEIIDEAILPEYFDELADKILEKNIDIEFFAYARLEEGFNEKVLRKLNKAGLRLVQWGYETGSRKILKDMNKGINPDIRTEVLKNTSENGIWNQIMMIVGFPTETEEDLIKTLTDFIQNRDMMNSVVFHKFKLEKHAQICSDYEKLNISTIENLEEFSPVNSFKKIINNKKISAERKEKNDIIKNMILDELWIKLICEEYIFLYLCHYSLEWLKNKKTI